MRLRRNLLGLGWRERRGKGCQAASLWLTSCHPQRLMYCQLQRPGLLLLAPGTSHMKVWRRAALTAAPAALHLPCYGFKWSLRPLFCKWYQALPCTTRCRHECLERPCLLLPMLKPWGDGHTHADGTSHEESFREGMAGLQCEAPQRPVLASAPPAHITWADQECTRDSLSDSCAQQDSVQLSPASCPGTLPGPTLVGTASAPPSGALGCGEAVPGPPAPARHIDVSSSTRSATAQRPLPHAGDRDGSAVAAFGLMHANSSKHRVVEAGEAADRFGSVAVAEGRLPGGCVRAVAHWP